MSKNQEIAETILQQLGGGRRLVMMVGAYNFVVVENGVAFKIKNAKANYIKIKLNSKDLYDLEVGRIRGTTYKVVTKKDDLYFDMLKPAIEEATGMYLSLFKKGGKMKEPTIVRGFSDDEPYEYAKGGMMEKGVVWDKDEDGYRAELATFKINISASTQKGYWNVYVTENKKSVGKEYDVYGIENAKNKAYDIISNLYKMAQGGLLSGCNYSIGGL